VRICQKKSTNASKTVKETPQIRSISFSREGRLLAGAAYHGPTVVWDLVTLPRTLGDRHDESYPS
jgi:hypothetical protein